MNDENKELEKNEDVNKPDEKNKKKKKGLLGVLIDIVAIIVLLLILLFGCQIGSKVNHTADPSFNEQIILPSNLKAYQDSLEENFKKDGLYYDDNVINILIGGIDEGNKDAYYGASNAMIIMSINKNDQKVRLASLSKDLYVKIEGHGNGRLCTAYMYGGGDLLVDTVQKNLKIRIDRYMFVSTETWDDVINIIGGIDIDLTAEEAAAIARASKTFKYIRYNLDTNFVDKGAGRYKLDGGATLLYNIMFINDNDYGRTGRQRIVMKKLFEKVKNINLRQAKELTKVLYPYVDTNFSKFEIISQITKILRYTSWDTKQAFVPKSVEETSKYKSYDLLIVNWDETIQHLVDFLYPTPSTQEVEKETTK